MNRAFTNTENLKSSTTTKIINIILQLSNIQKFDLSLL